MTKHALITICHLACMTAMSLQPVVCAAQNPQSYLNDTGATAYGQNIPVENGFININNGNLHLEFPLAGHPQRGALSLNERLVYDSRIWMFTPFGTHGSYHWFPDNVYGSPGTAGGWRFVNGGEIGTISHTSSANQQQCTPDNGEDPVAEWPSGGGGNQYHITTYYEIFTWTDPNGVSHPFNATWSKTEDFQCRTTTADPESTSGTATDGSGYTITMNGDTMSEPSDVRIVDSNGTQVYPSIIDRYGNYWSVDAQGNLVDDTGRTPVIVTQNGNTTYYDVLSANGTINNNGTRVRYIVTTALIPVHTSFGQSDTYELDWPQHSYDPLTFNPVQSIQLPDGSQYTFGYDIYGGLTSMTLPTGGTIHYEYSNFLDSANTENRWLTSRTVGSDPPTLLTPQVGTTCTNYSTGCKEYVTVHKPNSDSTIYEMTLVNGAWNTGTFVYSGTVPVYGGPIPPGTSPAANRLLFSTTTYQYSNGCSGPTCAGANYPVSSLTTKELFYNGNAGAYTQTKSTFDSVTGKPLTVKEWDYSSLISSMDTQNAPTSTPAREMDYSYSGYDLHEVKVLDSSGIQAGLTTYGYTSSAVTTSGISQHGTQNAGGPYLQTVSHWLNTSPSTPSVTTYSMDDTGEVRSVTDANQNNPLTVSYQCANSLPLTVTNPLGQATTYGYECGSGLISSVRDPNDLANSRTGTTYQYETTGRVHTVTDTVGGVTTYTYPSALEIDTSVLATPSPTIVSRSVTDIFGRTVQSIIGDSETDSQYDINGRAHCVSNPYTSGSTYSGPFTCVTSYDGLDRPLVVTEADGNFRGFTYNLNSIIMRDEAGNSTTRTQSALGYLTSVAEPGPAGDVSTTYAYDGLGHVKTVNQAGLASAGESPRTRQSQYDSLGRLLQAYSPEAGWTCYGRTPGNVKPTGSNCNYDGYDLNGNLLYKTDANATQIDYSYDALNRLHTRYSAKDPWTTNATLTYDQAGNGIGKLSIEWTSGVAATFFYYDELGRQINSNWFDFAHNAWVPGVHDVHFDLAGNLQKYTYSDNRQITQAWDASGRLTTVTDTTPNGPGTVYFQPTTNASEYDPSGSLTAATLGGIVSQSVTLNNRLQPCRLLATLGTAAATPGSATLLDRQLAYTSPAPSPCASYETGNRGNIFSILDNRTSESQNFAYDSLNRLTSGFTMNAPTYAAYSQSYNYDSFGSMLLNDYMSGALNYSRDPAGTNRLFLNGATGLQYNDNGSLKSDPYHTFDYTATGQLRCVNSSQGACTVGSYLYNALGERTFAAGNGGWHESAYFNGQLMTDMNDNGLWTDYIYVHGQKIARVSSVNTRVHLSGVYQPTSDGNRWDVGVLPIPSGVTIRPGDVLSFRMYKHNANGSISLGFTDGSNSDWYCGQCGWPIAASDQWQNASIAVGGSVSSPGPMAGKTLSYFFVGQHPGGPNGQFDVMISDIVLQHPDGSLVPFPMPLGAIPWGGDTTDVTNGSCVSETVPANGPTVGSAIGATPDTYYYLADQVGTTQMLLSSGGWPVWQVQFTPFGQEIINSAASNYIGVQPADGTSERFKFGMLERDPESGLDHAEFRMLAAVEGRWTSPDPYDGSMDLSNPQTLNRYAYVGNMPLNHNDPSGLFFESNGLGSLVGGWQRWVTLGFKAAGAVGVAYTIFEGIKDIVGLFSHPTFTASHKARPWDEHLPGGPNWGAQGFGLQFPGSQQCEFGACSVQTGFQSGVAALPAAGPFITGGVICVVSEPCGALAALVAGVVGSYGAMSVASQARMRSAACQAEWAQARRYCADLSINPKSAPNIWGGSFDKCVLGQVSQECGGNRVDWGKLHIP